MRIQTAYDGEETKGNSAKLIGNSGYVSLKNPQNVARVPFLIYMYLGKIERKPDAIHSYKNCR